MSQASIQVANQLQIVLRFLFQAVIRCQNLFLKVALFQNQVVIRSVILYQFHNRCLTQHVNLILKAFQYQAQLVNRFLIRVMIQAQKALQAQTQHVIQFLTQVQIL